MYPPVSQYRKLPGFSSQVPVSGYYSLGMGDPPREYHRAVYRERDGDVVMEDVDDCGQCGFGVEYQWEMNRRIELEKEMMRKREWEERMRIHAAGNIGAGLRYS